MTNNLFTLLFIIQTGLFAQNQSLNELINKSKFGESKLILVKNATVRVDTTAFKKIAHIRKDSLVKIRFKNNKTVQVNKKEFWGVITDYDEKRRFYNNDTYIIWRTQHPYIYKNLKTRNTNTYFFSKDLTDDIYPLTVLNVEAIISDTSDIKALKHLIDEVAYYNTKNEDHSMSKSDVQSDGSLIEFAAEIIYIILDKHPNVDRQKKQVLNDPQYKSQFPDTSLFK